MEQNENTITIDSAVSQKAIKAFEERFGIDYRYCLYTMGFSWEHFYQEYMKSFNPEKEVLGLLALIWSCYAEKEAIDIAIEELLKIPEIKGVFFKNSIFHNQFFPPEFIVHSGSKFIIALSVENSYKKYGKYVEGKVFFPFGMKKIKGKPGYYITFIPNGLYFCSVSGRGAISFVKDVANKFNSLYPNLLELGNIDFVMIDKLRELFFENKMENVKVFR